MAVNQNEDTSICNSPAKGSSSTDLLKRLNGVLSEKTTNPKRVRPFGPSTTGLCPLPWPIAMCKSSFPEHSQKLNQLTLCSTSCSLTAPARMVLFLR